VDTSGGGYPNMFISHHNGHGIKLVRPLSSTVDNTRDYARVSHSRQWSNTNYNLCTYTGSLSGSSVQFISLGSWEQYYCVRCSYCL